MAIEHIYKTKDGTQAGKLTPIKAIRHKCLDCCCWQINEVRACSVKTCALYLYRMGKTGRVCSKGATDALQKARSMQKTLSNRGGF